MLFSEYITIFADAVGGLTQKTKHTMRCKPSTNTKLTLFIVLLLVIDQAVKFTVKLNMELYQSIPVFGNWFIIHFIENPGAAFGMQLKYGVLNDYGAKKELLQDLILYWSHKQNKLVSFKEYADAMPEEQKYIYFATGSSKSRLPREYSSAGP